MLAKSPGSCRNAAKEYVPGSRRDRTTTSGPFLKEEESFGRSLMCKPLNWEVYPVGYEVFILGLCLWQILLSPGFYSRSVNAQVPRRAEISSPSRVHPQQLQGLPLSYCHP